MILIECVGRRGVRRDIYYGISGSTVASLRTAAKFPNMPDQSDIVDSFYSSDLGTNYGQRLSGYWIVPKTSNYTFYIVSDDSSELWLALNGNASTKSLYAYVNGYNSNLNNYGKYTTQHTAKIPLNAGMTL